jgi:hypothetical protein
MEQDDLVALSYARQHRFFIVGYPRMSKAPTFRITGPIRSCFSRAYAVPTEIASWPRPECTPPTTLPCL